MVCRRYCRRRLSHVMRMRTREYRLSVAGSGSLTAVVNVVFSFGHPSSSMCWPTDPTSQRIAVLVVCGGLIYQNVKKCFFTWRCLSAVTCFGLILGLISTL